MLFSDSITLHSKNLAKKILLTSSLLVGVATPLAMLSTSVSAATSSPSAVRNLNALLANTRSMTANFSQSGSGKNFSGTMQVQRPNHFRWQTNGSASQLIVANGSMLWIYDKDLNQVTRQRVSTQVGDTPALLLSGDPSKIASNFTVTQPDPKKNYFELFPKSSSANFKSLAIAFNSGNPVMMVLNDNLGQTTSISFSNIKRNVVIGAGQFSFTPPKGADVINQ